MSPPSPKRAKTEADDELAAGEQILGEAALLHKAGLALLQAAAENDLDGVRELLKSGAPAFYQDLESGWSALHFAAENQNAEMVSLLLREGGVWNGTDEAGHTAGDMALSLGWLEGYELIREEGIRTEVLLNLLNRRAEQDASDPASSLSAYLSSPLTYETDERGEERVLDEKGDGVMMGWEKPIMERTVQALTADHPDASPSEGLSVLNVGFGLGIIDTLFQSLSPAPSNHTIIEAHPDVLKHMRETGWYDKPGVRILEGKWQDFIDTDDFDPGVYDVIYFDTFSEHYHDLRSFFDALPALLRSPSSRFSFFHGLGATNALFYDVYTRIAELHLAEAGLDTRWADVEVGEIAHVWKGVRRSYWSLPCYKLPISTTG